MTIAFYVGLFIGFMFGFSLMACMITGKEKAASAHKNENDQMREYADSIHEEWRDGK